MKDSFDERLIEAETNKRLRENTDSIYILCRREGALFAVDYWCARYITLPVTWRYTLLYNILLWYGVSKLGRWLHNRGRK